MSNLQQRNDLSVMQQGELQSSEWDQLCLLKWVLRRWDRTDVPQMPEFMPHMSEWCQMLHLRHKGQQVDKLDIAVVLMHGEVL